MFPTTLIIGIGGVGSRIATNIYKQFMERQPSKTAIANFKCLCFDTDAGDIKEYLKVLPRDCVVQTSSSESITVNQYIDRIKDKTEVESWFDTSSEVIMKMKLNEGAGQVRMASRLAYMSAISEEKLSVINRSIISLLETDPERHNGNDIKVHIICSLAGGTGAGSFLQTAYCVKDIMRSQNIGAPIITGYFVLGDVLCHDKVANLNEKQKENTRSNTYACMKELAAFTHQKESQLIKEIDFEYKIGQEDRHLPPYDPYDQCYMIDFTSTDGGNIGDMKVYYDQVKDFVYMNAFSPMGDTQRSLLINDTIQKIQTEGKGRFAAIGVSKMIFPVDDLYEYFAIQRLVDNLSATWVCIDNEFKEEYDKYKRNQREGIETADEPEIGDYFMRSLATKATSGTGIEGLEFKVIFESTKDGNRGDKSDIYVDSIKNYVVEDVIHKNPTFNDHYENCCKFNRFAEDVDDKENDVDTVVSQEEKLDNFLKEVMTLIDASKRGVTRECFLMDAGLQSRVSKDFSTTQHHLNTHILPKEKEMHPLAVRYFLYQIRERIKNELEELKEANKGLKNTITVEYKKMFDIKDDKLSPDNREETAAEAMETYHKKSGFGKKALIDFKEKYQRKSKEQRENIKKYAEDKLFECVLEGLQDQIRQLIEESENFFKLLPDTIRNLQNQCKDLLEKHEGKTNPSVMYVLAKQEIKKKLYEEIRKEDSLFFPSDISARIYRTMFDNTKLALEENVSLGSLSDDEEAADAKEKSLIEANNQLFNDVIKQQIRLMKKKLPGLLEMNILQALQKEGSYYKHTKLEVLDYMKEKINNLSKMAVIRGAYNIDADLNRYINSWGINNLRGFTEEEQTKLFSPNDATPQDIADREPNPFYSPYELVRVNSVSLLELENNFRGFSNKKSGSDDQIGTYLKAYIDINKRLVAGENDFSRHLDKHWQLPAYMPNIGEKMDDITNDIFKALYYGLLFDKFSVVNKEGDDYWYYKGEQSDFLTDFNGYYISFDQSTNLEAGLNELFERGLIDNPSIVDYLKEYIDEEWQRAKTEWHRTERPSGCDVLDIMKQHSLIKKMMGGFDYGSIYSKWSGKKWFSFMSSSNNSTLSRTINNLKTRCIDDLMDHILNVFEPSANTYKLCKELFALIPDNAMKAVAVSELEQYKSRHKFELRRK